MQIKIPGKDLLDLKNIVFDYNGTIAFEGALLPFVPELIEKLKKEYIVYILTSDTYGTARKACKDLGVNIDTLSGENVSQGKANFVKKLGAKNTICIGNGTNDVGMFKEAALAIAVIGKEGCAVQALNEADIVVNNIQDAFNLLLNTKNLIATLRG